MTTNHITGVENKIADAWFQNRANELERRKIQKYLEIKDVLVQRLRDIAGEDANYVETLSNIENCTEFKGTLSPWKKISYMKDINFLNTVNRFKNSSCPPFTPKLADLAENVRLKGAEK